MTGSDIIDLLFESRDTAHQYHHITKKYSEHQALGAFYEAIEDIMDEFAECYYGKYGRKNRFIKISVQQYSETAALDYMLRLKSIFLTQRPAEISADTELNNILDEAAALVDKTIYLLEMV